VHLLIVDHEVEDYERFEASVAAHPPSRGGARTCSVSRGFDDPNHVLIVAGFDTLAPATAWRDDPELRTAIAAGIVGEPRVGVFEQVDGPAS
jgi:hypothetical protein